MQSFIIKEKTVLTKCRQINRTVNSYHKDLNLVKLILIYKLFMKFTSTPIFKSIAKSP
jgi:hypothetical protein